MIKKLWSKFRPLILFLIPFGIEIVYLMAFYPGVLTVDSIYQWAQLSEFKFTNWHPAYHTILMWLITRIWYSPAAVALFQALVYSLVITYGLLTFRQEFGIADPWLIITDIFISLVMINGLMVVTLWKDVLYSICVLLLTIFLLRIIKSKGGWLASPIHWIMLGFITANVSLLRLNGFPVAFGTVLVCFFFKNRKALIESILLALLTIFVVTGPVYRLFKVDRSFSQTLGVVFLHPIAAQVNAGSELTTSQREFLNSMLPLSKGWPYSCYDATVLFYNGFKFEPVQRNSSEAVKIFLDLTIQHPGVTLKHYACLSSFVWQIRQPKNVNLESIITYNTDLSNRPQWQQYQPFVTQRSKLPALRNLIIRILNGYQKIDQGLILLRPAIYMYVFIAFLLAAGWRSRNKNLLFLAVPLILQSIVIAFSAQLQALRYEYPVYLISMLFSLPLLIVTIKNSTVTEGEHLKTLEQLAP